MSSGGFKPSSVIVGATEQNNVSPVAPSAAPKTERTALLRQPKRLPAQTPPVPVKDNKSLPPTPLILNDTNYSKDFAKIYDGSTINGATVLQSCCKVDPEKVMSHGFAQEDKAAQIGRVKQVGTLAKTWGSTIIVASLAVAATAITAGAAAPIVIPAAVATVSGLANTVGGNVVDTHGKNMETAYKDYAAAVKDSAQLLDHYLSQDFDPANPDPVQKLAMEAILIYQEENKKAKREIGIDTVKGKSTVSGSHFKKFSAKMNELKEAHAEKTKTASVPLGGGFVTKENLDAAIATAFTNLNQRVNVIEESVANVETELTGVENSVAGINSRLGTVEGTVAALQQKVTKLESENEEQRSIISQQRVLIDQIMEQLQRSNLQSVGISPPQSQETNRDVPIVSNEGETTGNKRSSLLGSVREAVGSAYGRLFKPLTSTFLEKENEIPEYTEEERLTDVKRGLKMLVKANKLEMNDQNIDGLNFDGVLDVTGAFETFEAGSLQACLWEIANKPNCSKSALDDYIRENVINDANDL